MFLTEGGNTGTSALLFASPEKPSVKVDRSNTAVALLALEPERFVKGCPWCFLLCLYWLLCIKLWFMDSHTWQHHNCAYKDVLLAFRSIKTITVYDWFQLSLTFDSAIYIFRQDFNNSLGKRGWVFVCIGTVAALIKAYYHTSLSALCRIRCVYNILYIVRQFSVCTEYTHLPEHYISCAGYCNP